MASQRETRDWNGNCKVSLSGGISYDATAELVEIVFDEILTAWVGRVDLKCSMLEHSKIRGINRIGIELADGRKGTASITSLRSSGDDEQPPPGYLPPGIKLPSVPETRFVYFSGNRTS